MWKKLHIYIDDGMHAQLLAKFRYDNFKQKTFLKSLLAAYIADNPLMRQLIEDINTKKISKKQKARRSKDQKDKEQTITDFALNEDDIENIFDEIEKENPDI